VCALLQAIDSMAGGSCDMAVIIGVNALVSPLYTKCVFCVAALPQVGGVCAAPIATKLVDGKAC
jgi:hypothetical protein